MSEAIDRHRAIWNRKQVLRTIYATFYDRILTGCVPGLTIEVGGGLSNLRRRLPQIITSDVQFEPSLDCVADAQQLPFASAVAANIVMVDMLHHLEYPPLFFAEAERVLEPGGRIIMVEPAITWGSTLFYRLFHHEPVRTRTDPLVHGRPDPTRDPYESNQAIPTLLATRHRDRFHQLFPQLRISRVEWFSFLAYPLSGGFKAWSLISDRTARKMLHVERVIEPIMGRWAAFRMLLVIEKSKPRSCGRSDEALSN